MAKIVVIDDEIDICQILKFRLEEDGHEVRTFRFGDEAIDCGYLFYPDILITDWSLNSEYSGLEVVDAIHWACPYVKTILTTSYSVRRLTEIYDFKDIFEIIPKPFSLEAISLSVRRALA